MPIPVTVAERFALLGVDIFQGKTLGDEELFIRIERDASEADRITAANYATKWAERIRREANKQGERV